MRKVGIVIPAYNEARRISRTLEKYLDYFKQENLHYKFSRLDAKEKSKPYLQSKKEDFKIIVVLNGCKDNTLEVVKEFECEKLIILNFEKAGKGFAITEGFKEAIKQGCDLIGFVDADMSTPPNAFYGLVENIKCYDGIIADRWDKRSKITLRQSLFRRFISQAYNLIVRSLFIFSYRDTQCGAKLFTKELLEKIIPKLGFSEWGFDVDLLFYARREKSRIISIPTEWHDEKGSHINLKKTPITMFLAAVRLRLIHSPLRFIVRAYTILPEKLKFHSML